MSFKSFYLTSSESMIPLLLCLLLLESCFGTSQVDQQLEDDERPNFWKAFGKRASSKTERNRHDYCDDSPTDTGVTGEAGHSGAVTGVAGHSGAVSATVVTTKSFGDPGDYISTVIFTDLPLFSDLTDVGDVSGGTDNFNIQYSNVEFYSLSSAYALAYKIDLDANMVQLLLSLGTAQIKGAYSVSSSRNSEKQAFELNLYANLIYTYNVAFQFKSGKATFGKSDNHQLLYSKVKGKYTNPPSGLASNLENYLDPKLLEAVVDRIYDEVSRKVSLEDVGYQIKNELIFRNRKLIAGRFQKAFTDAYDDIRQHFYNTQYRDSLDFVRIIHNFEVRIPSFVLRDIEGFKVSEFRLTYVGDDVYARTKYLVPNPLIVFRVVYRDRFDSRSPNKTIKAEYRLLDLTFQSEIVARPETETVEFASSSVTGRLVPAESQGKYGDEGDIIVDQLTQYLQPYFEMNAYHPYQSYVEGLLAEGRIAYNLFKR